MQRLDARRAKTGYRSGRGVQVRAHEPSGRNPTSLTAKAGLIPEEGDGPRIVWIDPYSGAVTEETGRVTVGRFIRDMHAKLFRPVIGRSVMVAGPAFEQALAARLFEPIWP